MTDTVIKGSGNSRSFKTVPNIKSMVHDLDELLDLFVAGFPIDLGPLNDAGVLTHGTDLNKANLLTDETADILGGPDTVNEALIKTYQNMAGVVWSAFPGSSGNGIMAAANGNGIIIALKARNESVVANKVTNQADIYVDGYYVGSHMLPYTTIWQDIAYNDADGVFVAVGYGASGNYNIGDFSAYTRDGVSWYGVKLPSKDSWNLVGCGNGIFVAFAVYAVAGSTNRLTISFSEDNGRRWSLSDPVQFHPVSAVAYGHNKFIAVAPGQTAIYSENGKTWNTMQMPKNASWSDIKFINGRFIAVASDSAPGVSDNKGCVYYSDDGETWVEPEYIPFASPWKKISYGNGRIVIVPSSGGSTAVYSDDYGVTWKSSLPFPVHYGWKEIIYDNGRFVAMAQDHSTFMMSGALLNQRKPESLLAEPVAITKDTYTETQLLGQQITDLELTVLDYISTHK